MNGPGRFDNPREKYSTLSFGIRWCIRHRPVLFVASKLAMLFPWIPAVISIKRQTAKSLGPLASAAPSLGEWKWQNQFLLSDNLSPMSPAPQEGQEYPHTSSLDRSAWCLTNNYHQCLVWDANSPTPDSRSDSQELGRGQALDRSGALLLQLSARWRRCRRWTGSRTGWRWDRRACRGSCCMRRFRRARRAFWGACCAEVSVPCGNHLGAGSHDARRKRPVPSFRCVPVPGQAQISKSHSTPRHCVAHVESTGIVRSISPYVIFGMSGKSSNRYSCSSSK